MYYKHFRNTDEINFILLSQATDTKTQWILGFEALVNEIDRVATYPGILAFENLGENLGISWNFDKIVERSLNF